MAALLTICQDAMAGVLNYNGPTQFSSIVGNTDPGAVLLQSCAQQVGRELTRGYNWEELKKPYSFTTSAGAEGYALPSDFQRFCNLTLWSQNDHWPLIQASNVAWRELKSGIVISGVRYYFNVFGRKLNINPIPGASTHTIAYDYYSKQYCTNAAGVWQDDWLADTDIPILDAELLTLGIRMKFLSRHKLPYAEEKGDYLQAIKDFQADNTTKSIIDVGRLPNRNWPINVPDANWNI